MFSIKASRLLGKYYHSSIPDTEISGVCYDTRNMTANSVFVCIKGEKDDGHRFARYASQKGARIIIAEKNIDCNSAVILTDDTMSALRYLTKRFYGKPKPRLVGITGTNGKTTTSYMLLEILKCANMKVGIIGTNGSFANGKAVGIEQSTPTTPNMPELYAMLSEMRDMDYVVMEVSSHALSQKRVDGLEFEAGVFTNLSGDHLDYHKNMEDYFLAKKQLFDISKIGVVNADDVYGDRILKEYKNTIGVGISRGEIRAENIRLNKDSTEFELLLGKKRIVLKINATGLFNVYNALAASAAAYALGIDAESINEGLSAFGGVVGRMERVVSGGINVIIDYAHTPDGLLKVLQSLKGIGAGIITVFGCGGDRDRTKRAVMGKIATENSKLAVITSDNPRTEQPTEIIIDILAGVKKDNYIVTPDREKAIELALGLAKSGDTVLLAGKGQETYQIVGKEKRHFDEREIVAKYLKGE